jgi:uncharacterized ferritin-like protein (DUF455 family)
MPGGAQAIGSIQDAALACLLAADPQAKLAATAEHARAWRAGARADAGDRLPPPERLPLPGRPARPRLVPPRQLPQRSLGSRDGLAALIHAVAHIEFNAIDLAWDAVYRFRAMPRAFYDDWVGVAVDEARHFALLAGRLAAHGHAYGDFDAHNGLWEMALRTDQDCLARMALVPRVLEARGLDVTPAMIERVRAAGDPDTAGVLALILREEVAHVAAGSRWLRWLCERQGRDPEATFTELLGQQAPGVLRRPFNRPAREQAGFSAGELDALEALTAP